MTLDSDPAVQQAQLTRRLTQLRAEQGLSQVQVAQDLGWSYHKMMRFETGKQVLPKMELEALLRRYGVLDTPTGDEIATLGDGARRSAWWKPYGAHVSRDYLRFVGLEAGASSIREVQMSVVPGLLQTPEYARVITATCRSHEAIEPIVELRKKRQEKLRQRSQPPTETYIIDESTLRRHVGKNQNPRIMQDQIKHLIELSENKNINIHINPQDSDWTFGMSHSFTILKFAVDLEDILFKESVDSCSTTKETEETNKRKAAFAELMSHHALAKDSSQRLLKTIHQSLTG